MEKFGIGLMAVGMVLAAPVIGIMSAIVGFMSVNPFLQVPMEVQLVIGHLSFASIMCIGLGFVSYVAALFSR